MNINSPDNGSTNSPPEEIRSINNPLIEAIKIAMQSPNNGDREEAVRNLDRLLLSDDPLSAQFAYQSLKQLTKDDSRVVSEAAAQSVTAYEARIKGTAAPIPTGSVIPIISSKTWLWGISALGGLAVLGIAVFTVLLLTKNPLTRSVPFVGAKALASPMIDAGNQIFDNGNIEQAVDEYTKAIEVDADNVEALIERGNALTEKASEDPTALAGTKPGVLAIDQAIIDYTKAVTLAPTNTNANTGLATGQVIRGGWNNGGNMVLVNPRNGRQIRPPRIGIARRPGTIFNPNVFDAPTQVLVNECINKRNAKACNNAAALLTNNGDLQNANTMVHNARNLDPNNPIYASNNGWLGIQSGNIGQALKDFQDAINKNPNSASAWSGQCWAFQKMAPPNLNTALVACNKAEKLNPNNCSMLIGKGLINQALGNNGDGLDYCRKGQKCLEEQNLLKANEIYLGQQTKICQCENLTKLGRFNDAVTAGAQAVDISNNSPKSLRQGAQAKQCIARAVAQNQAGILLMANIAKEVIPVTPPPNPVPPTPAPPPIVFTPEPIVQQPPAQLDCRFRSSGIYPLWAGESILYYMGINPFDGKFQIVIDLPAGAIKSDQSYSLITTDGKNLYPCKILEVAGYTDSLYCTGMNTLEGYFVMDIARNISATEGESLCEVSYTFPRVAVIPTSRPSNPAGNCYTDSYGKLYCPGNESNPSYDDGSYDWSEDDDPYNGNPVDEHGGGDGY